MPPLLIALALALPLQDAPPSSKEQLKLVEAYVDLDSKTREGRAAQLEILAQLAAVPGPSASDAKSWAKKIDKLRKQLPTFEKKSGRRHWWEEEERGLYIVGGETKKPKGLFIGMHGGGVGSGDAGSSASTYGSAVGKLDWVGIFPEVLEKTEHGWTDSGTEEWIVDMVDAALRTWKIDPDRVYFGGHSMGGYGTWVLGAHHADRVAGLAASAGAPSPYYDREGNVVGIMDGVIPNLRNVPLVVFQSIDDERVPPDVNQYAAKEVEKARETWGGYDKFDYWEVDGYGHGLPNKGAIELLERVEGERRVAHPDKITWQPSLPWKRQFYWLFWEVPDKRSVVVAELDRSANAIAVEVTGPAEGLCVLLSADVVDMKKPVRVTLGGEVVFEGVPEPDFPTFVMTAAGGDPERTYLARVPLVP